MKSCVKFVWLTLLVTGMGLLFETVAESTTGPAELKVMEDFGKGEVEALSQSVDLKGRTELDLKIPAGDLQARKVKVVLKNPANGLLLAKSDLGEKRDIVKCCGWRFEEFVHPGGRFREWIIESSW